MVNDASVDSGIVFANDLMREDDIESSISSFTSRSKQTPVTIRFRVLRVGCCLSLIFFPMAILVGWLWHLINESAPLSSLLVDRPWATQSFSLIDMGNIMTLAPLHYPESLHGVLWMDQAGEFGHSDLSANSVSPDLSVAFGDPSTPLDAETRVQNINIVGPGWSWSHQSLAYGHFDRDKIEEMQLGGHFYRFVWNKDYSAAELFMCTSTCGYKPHHTLPSFMKLGLLMQKQSKPASCPPDNNATKKEVAACADFDRVTTLKIKLPWVGYVTAPFFRFHYPVFKVMDSHGKPLEPYYSAFTKHVASNYKPNHAAAKEHNIMSEEKESSKLFIGTGACSNCASTPMEPGISPE